MAPALAGQARLDPARVHSAGSLASVDRILMTSGASRAVARSRCPLRAPGSSAAAAAAGLCLWRARSNGVRLLVAFLGHPPRRQPRQRCAPDAAPDRAPAVPAALLRPARFAPPPNVWRPERPRPGTLRRAIPAVVVALLLVAGAQPDHHTAAEAATLQARGRVPCPGGPDRAVGPRRGAVRLTLINMPNTISGRRHRRVRVPERPRGPGPSGDETRRRGRSS